MAAISSKNTTPELIVRRFLRAKGVRYRLHVPTLPGRPDIVVADHRLAVFVNGCFWHGHSNCKRAALPSTNAVFWKNKIRSNVARDRRTASSLRREGWKVFNLWQCSLRRPTSLVRLLAQVSDK
jgi:DNA mismatch endonuclease, patch repair protein